LGKEISELRKLVIWEEEENASHDDFCGICMEFGDLIMCEGCCWRSFHLFCVNLEELPEGSWMCALCTPEEKNDEQGAECFVCGISGYFTSPCKGTCGRVFHLDCVGLTTESTVDYVCAQCRFNEEKEASNVNVIQVQLDVEVEEKENEQTYVSKPVASPLPVPVPVPPPPLILTTTTAAVPMVTTPTTAVAAASASTVAPVSHVVQTSVVDFFKKM
jgi:hypothetical protein